MELPKEKIDDFGSACELDIPVRRPSDIKPKDRAKLEKQLFQMLESGADLTPFEEECVDAWGLRDKHLQKLIDEDKVYIDTVSRVYDISEKEKPYRIEALKMLIKNEVRLTDFEYKCARRWKIFDT